MRVAVVDLSRTMRKYVTRLLQARDHEVHQFADGPETLARMRADGAFDALITSLELREMSGLELCWETRVLAGRDRPIYIVLMSSSADRRKLVEALDAGADDFMAKPPAPDELYARLRAGERLGQMQRELVRFASLDPLTGAYNRRVFFELAEDASRRARVMSAIMLDIDHFKRVNDLFGHDVGDRAIAAVAQIAQSHAAVVGRLGGEEFAMLLEGASLAEGLGIAERMRAQVAAHELATAKGPLTLSCSFGVGERTAGEAIDALLRRADLALYAAKNGGRNRVVAADAAAAPLTRRPGSVIRVRAG
jgi:diguanylate cyclase (GGDEF)-like protein